MQTPATKRLDALGLAWSGHSYTHDPDVRDFGMEAARELGIEPSRVFKTLVVRVDGATYAVGVIPVNLMLDLKKIAGAAGGKRSELATVADAERITGYVHGGISPIAQRRALPTFVHHSAVDFETIFVSGGRRGFDIEVAGSDLLRACNGHYVDLCRSS